MTYRIAVVAHTARLAQAEQLANQVGAVYMTIDDGTLGCNRNHTKAWQWHHRNTTTPWAIALEDDAQPIKDFHNQLTQALTHTPTPITSLYLGRQRPPQWQAHIRRATHKADQMGATYITHTHLLHAVAVAIRTDLLGPLLTHHTTKPIDEHITHWAMEHGHSIAYTWPSLVDHADGPTLVSHRDGHRRTPGRRAWRTGPAHWTPTAVDMGTP